MMRKKREKSTKPLRNCSAQRHLFIEAGLERKNDRHLLCTWSTTALTGTQTNTPKHMRIDTLLEQFLSSFSQHRSRFFFPPLFSFFLSIIRT